MIRLLSGHGAPSAGSPYEQGRAAARAALEQAGETPPALALLAGHGTQNAAEILSGARAALGDCPLMGLVSDPAARGGGSAPPEGVRILLLASRHLRAKVGSGAGGDGGPGWEEETQQACRESFIETAVSGLPASSSELHLYHWYRYRRPSLALAAVISPPGQRRAREIKIASFIRRKLHSRVPLLMLSLPADAPGAVILADGRVVASGVVLTMIKTDLKFSLERFHSFEPAGPKLFVTRSEGDRILECNGLPAIEAYRQALGLEPGATGRCGAGTGPFSLFPLAHRSRDGRFVLLVPEEIGEDGSLRFPGAVEPDRVLYPMKAVPAADIWRVSSRPDTPHPDVHRAASTLLVRNTCLRDLPEVVPDLAGEGAAGHLVDLPCGLDLKAFLTAADTGAEAGHLLLSFERELDPFAVAAGENERLLKEVVQLKDLHQRIFDNIGYGIAVVDASRRIVFCNATYRRLLAGSTASLEGRPCPWSVGPNAICGTCACEDSIAHDAPVNREVARLEAGKTHWFRLDTFPLRDAAGAVTAAIEVMRDVTAFKDLSRSLESEQRKMEAVIRGMGETLYIVNPKYDLQFFHRGVFPVADEIQGDVRNRKCYEALFRRKLPCPWCCMHETVLSGSVERRVAHLAGESGEDRSYQVTFSPWGAGQGDQAAVVCLLVDISGQKRLEQQLVLSEKLNSLSILSAGMAHELNNPLGAINFNLEILKRRERDEEYREVLESIRKDVLRINRIVGNLLSFSRSGAASLAWIAMPEVIDVALELFQVVIERRRIEVRRAYAKGLPLVWGNAQDLQQVYINLIANAVDAMPSGGVIDIAVEADAHAGAPSGPASVAVVYDVAGDLAFLRALMDVPGMEVRFFRGDGEAIDFFRQNPTRPPEVLLLDFAATDPARVDFFMTMAREYAPAARFVVIADPGQGDERWARIAGSASVFPRPLETSRLLEQVRTIVDGLREQHQRSAAVRVHFSDTGVGIAPDVLARIFDPFFTTKEAKGTGLGLSVVHKILENNSATVQVGSTPGEGTVFTIQFTQTRTPGPGGVGDLRLREGNGFGRGIA